MDNKIVQISLSLDEVKMIHAACLGASWQGQIVAKASELISKLEAIVKKEEPKT